jgi:alpha-tubulin suppressor-like RCC1 family protein
MGENLAAVTLDGSAERIACGDDFNCALLENDRLYCWGQGTEGQLGPMSGDYSWSPEYVPINDGLNAIDGLALGGQHGCGWSSAGDVRCWGFNRHGQLAMGHTTSHGLNPLDFSSAWQLAGVQGAVPLQALGAGYNMTCSLAEGDVRCWGEDTRGALGISITPETDDIGDEEGEHFYGVDPLRFRDVPNGSVKAIGVGDYHACALLADGSVACWGDNTKGQLGIGSSAAADLAITDTVAELPAPARIN